MSFELITGQLVTGVSPNTTPVIVYDDDTLCRDSSSTEDIRPPKRGISLSQIVFASSLMAFTTPNISLPNLQLSGPTRLTFDQTGYSGTEESRRITLREARCIAMQAHYQFEEGLRRDRIQEARIMDLANENNA
jgi:hypothetical protein